MNIETTEGGASPDRPAHNHMRADHTGILGDRAGQDDLGSGHNDIAVHDAIHNHFTTGRVQIPVHDARDFHLRTERKIITLHHLACSQHRSLAQWRTGIGPLGRDGRRAEKHRRRRDHACEDADPVHRGKTPAP